MDEPIKIVPTNLLLSQWERDFCKEHGITIVEDLPPQEQAKAKARYGNALAAGFRKIEAKP